MGHYSTIKRNEVPTHATIQRKLKNIMFNGKTPNTKGHILYGPIYMKYQEQIMHRDIMQIGICQKMMISIMESDCLMVSEFLRGELMTKNFGNRQRWWLHNTGHVLSAPELFTLKSVNFMLHNFFKKSKRTGANTSWLQPLSCFARKSRMIMLS